ncbi:hypothetical protein BX666DRAFT_930059 [Dichotomocladium elegans]|nr:hypothetical protein BX666DRAFT_930059 [Dichotomocladium elegans]
MLIPFYQSLLSVISLQRTDYCLCKRMVSSSEGDVFTILMFDVGSSINRHQHSHSMTPSISIHSPDANDIDEQRATHLTVDTRQSPIRSQKSSSDTFSKHSTLMEADALYSSLLYFIIQYLDPYLSLVGSETTEPLAFSMIRQSSSIFNFHRALQYMINQKSDIYLDLLNAISYGSTEVKFRACQILFHYYGTSTGHVVVAESLPALGYNEEISVLRTAMDRQTYEEERQRQQQQQTDPTFLETMIGSSAALNVNGINRKYRASVAHAASNATEQSAEILTEDESHIWYPHMFLERADEPAVQIQRFSTTTSLFGTVVYDDLDGACCKECFKPIQGFGLRCYQCKCSLHYSCMGNNDLGIMLYVKEGGIQKVVSPQFSIIPTQPRTVAAIDTRDIAEEIHLFGHHFQLVNLFTLIPCASCRFPLWGISYQGYRCATCNRFVHSTCLAAASRDNGFKHELSTIHSCHPYQPLRESDTKISQENLCQNLKSYYGNMLPTSDKDLENCSFEEVCLMLNVLLLQDNILRCGVASGCLLIGQVSDDPLLGSEWISPNVSESYGTQRIMHASPVLRDALQLCLDYIMNDCSQPSRFRSDYYGSKPRDHGEYLLSQEIYLSHICAMMKSLVLETRCHRNIHAAGGHSHLQVETWDEDLSDADRKKSPEVLDGNSMVDWIIENLRFKSRKSAVMLLQHMRNLGLLERQDGSPVLFFQEDNPICIFPIPFAIDFSPKVESVIDAIDACLADIDITLNEYGMLLLVRRCWPDPFLSQYICERLIHSVFSWVFDEDEKLSIIHAEYAGNKQQLPGVRQNRWAQAAQMALMLRMKNGAGAPDKNRQSISFSNAIGISSGAGSVYVTTRNALRDRYIARWVAAIHDMDRKAYAAMAFDVIERILDGKSEGDTLPEWVSARDKQVMRVRMETTQTDVKLSIAKYCRTIRRVCRVPFKTENLWPRFHCF